MNCAQVKGAAEIMVTVLATQELKSGDMLWRFKAEAAQDEPRGGNNNNRINIMDMYGSGSSSAR